MLAKIEYKGQYFSVHLNQPVDISIPMQNGLQNPNAFGISAPVFEPFKAGGFIGSVALGGSVNCENLQFNPHGNGTHTECVGHISKERITIHETLQEFMFMAQLVTVELNQVGDDHKVLLTSIKDVINNDIDALIIRTTPNDTAKLTQTYSGKNPAYLQEELCAFLCDLGIKHLIIDLPSVDREEDGGALAAHHAFWNYPASPRFDATITEMAYIPNQVMDGLYVLNLQIASLQTDASPSKPVLYKISHVL